MKRVIKLGGSFLTCSDLESRLQRWQQSVTPAHTLAIVGGGGLVNAIRDMDAIASLEERTTHWRCVELLSHTFEIMAQRLNWPTIQRPEELEQWIQAPTSKEEITLVRVDTFYRESNTAATINGTSRWNSSIRDLLPENWDTTTDSIAAMLAWGIQSSELVILKSCPVSPEATLRELAAAGIVDQALPQIAEKVSNVRVEQLAAA